MIFHSYVSLPEDRPDHPPISGDWESSFPKTERWNQVNGVVSMVTKPRHKPDCNLLPKKAEAPALQIPSLFFPTF